MPNSSARTPWWRKLIKITLWTLMALVLAFAAMVICIVKLLDSESLTRITQKTVNELLDADVRIGRVEIDLAGRMPLLKLRIDSVTVISGPMLRLDPALHGQLPQWADTLLVLKRFEAGLNVGALPFNKIDLYDVEFEEPEINLVSVNDSIANYIIYNYHPTAEEPDTSSVGMPKVSINRFSILSPRPLRFHNASTGEHFDVRLKTLNIDGGNQPTYRLDVGGDMLAPSLALYNLDNLSFGLNGHVHWEPEKPTELELRDFDFHANFLDASANAHVDFAREIIVRDYGFEIKKTRVDQLLSFVPDSLRTAYGLDDKNFASDCAISFKATSNSPFNLTRDSIPDIDARLTIYPGSLRYQMAEFRNLEGELAAFFRGNDLNKAYFQATDLKISGPATDLVLNIKASEVLGDPLVEGSIEGQTELSRLPLALRRMIGGTIRGNLKANLRFNARPSMLSRNNFHRLHVHGDLSASRLFYLSADTADMLTVNHASLEFGSHTPGVQDSLLTAVIRVDTANYLHTQYDMKFAGLTLGVGASNARRSADTTVVVPMGGDLRLGKFYLTVLGDSIAYNMRDSHGRITMKRYNNEKRRPEFGLDIEVGHISSGSPDVRFLLSQAKIDIKAHKLKWEEKTPKALRHTADSLRRVFPRMPIDSVYARAIQIARSKKPGRYPRVHLDYNAADENQLIDWGTSKFLRDLLLGWQLNGSITARRAGLYTPYFPLRNRVRDFNITFDNDSIRLRDIKYKVGSSDFLLSGYVANLKRGLTSKTGRSPLKLNFNVVSDTVDVNELASSTFRGSAYAASQEARGKHAFSLESLADSSATSEEAFEREVGKFVANAPDSMAPLMVPANIEASLNVHANNILYSDILFHNLIGDVLLSQGSLNLHDLKASSEMGSVKLSALYSTPQADSIKFGFGMQVDKFNIQKFTRLVPAIDSLMPLLRDFQGIVDADIAATCDVDKGMNLVLPNLEAAIKLSGDSLVLIDPDTYKTIGKWLLFKDKQDNVIKHMNVELTIANDMMQLYPFIFDLDRYKLGVQGHNDLALNFDYHIAVLKSPLPFKFGINLKGNPDKYKIRVGRARLNEKQVAQSVAIVDTTRVNLLTQLENVFRRGVRNSRFARLNLANVPSAASINLDSDTISRADSLVFIREGLIPAPPAPVALEAEKSKKKKSRKKKSGDTTAIIGDAWLGRGFFLKPHPIDA